MKISMVYAQFLLMHREGHCLDFANVRKHPAGLTGSEVGLTRIAQELTALGHEVTIYCPAKDTVWEGMAIRPIEELGQHEADATLSLNDPRPLAQAKGLRVCIQWINSFEYAGPRFWENVDLWLSPSKGHRDYILSREHEVYGPAGALLENYVPDPTTWDIAELGCDPHHFDPTKKVPGRVVYCSSPDRGLHWLLKEWPQIKRAVPHATLKIFYRLAPWIEQFKNIPPFGDEMIERLRARAFFIEECLSRLKDPKWGITVCDAVSREQIERELSEAQCLAYPCDPVNEFTEGFSCSILEGCAAQACPIITSVDALGELYGGTLPMVDRGEWGRWRELVVSALTDEYFASEVNTRARAFAEARTWKATAARVEDLVASWGSRPRSSTKPESSKTCLTSM